MKVELAKSIQAANINKGTFVTLERQMIRVNKYVDKLPMASLTRKHDRHYVQSQ